MWSDGAIVLIVIEVAIAGFILSMMLRSSGR